jgi:hypothetical protein
MLNHITRMSVLIWDDILVHKNNDQFQKQLKFLVTSHFPVLFFKKKFLVF